MKLLMLIYSGPAPQRIAALLEAHDVQGYSEIRDVHGSGTTGRLLGTRAWPGSSHMLLSIVPDAQVAALTAALRDYKRTATDGEHLHGSVLPVDDSF